MNERKENIKSGCSLAKTNNILNFKSIITNDFGQKGERGRNGSVMGNIVDTPFQEEASLDMTVRPSQKIVQMTVGHDLAIEWNY